MPAFLLREGEGGTKQILAQESGTPLGGLGLAADSDQSAPFLGF